METTVRDSVGGMAKISILNTSYFWPDDVAHMESETKSETVPLLWKLGFLAAPPSPTTAQPGILAIRPAICQVDACASIYGRVSWQHFGYQQTTKSKSKSDEGDFWLPHFIWPGRNFQLTQVASSVKAFVFHAPWPILDSISAWPAKRRKYPATLIAKRYRICAVCVINTKLIKTSVWQLSDLCPVRPELWIKLWRHSPVDLVWPGLAWFGFF